MGVYHREKKWDVRLKWIPVSNGKQRTPSVLCWDHQVGTIDIYSACVEVGTIDKYSACVEVGTINKYSACVEVGTIDKNSACVEVGIIDKYSAPV
ncbi:hypothetical protein TNCV_106231 [Trichonephila clavipes]|nr:hypothetical protein TNCV_106231 [Trichonephila clavipes]